MLLGTIRACFLERLLGDKELIGVDMELFNSGEQTLQ